MKLIRQDIQRAMFALAFGWMAANPVGAASILWSSPTLISGDTDVISSGTLLYAYSVGNTGVPGATVNGVMTFAPFVVPHGGSGPVNVDSVTLAIDNQTFYTANTAAGSDLPPFVNLSTGYKGLLESGSSAAANFSTFTLTLGGLNIGQNYLVQFWSNDSGTLANRFGGTIYTAGNAVTLDNNVSNIQGGLGQWVTGSFTADASTEVLGIESSTPSIDYPVINAFQVRAVPVPEPETLALLALGAATIAGRSWRRRRAIRG